MDNLQLHATARVKLTKKDADGKIISVEEREINLTDKEAQELWHSQQQA